MGHFLAVTAVRAPLPDVAQSVADYCEQHSLSCTPLSASDAEEKTDTLLFESGEWTIVLWPPYFNVHDFPAASHLSAKLDCLASTINVYDDDCWCHGLFDQGELLDQFASAPDLVELEPEEWLGNADVVASKLGADAVEIAPYFQHIDEDTDYDAKVHPDDEFPLADFWVFCDLWRRCSITYPDDMSTFTTRLRLGKDFADRLPFNE